MRYRDTSGEFAVCVDGWYWQWRRVRVEEDIGTAMGPLNGAFASETEARAHEADPNNKICGMSRGFDADSDKVVCGVLSKGPFDFYPDE